MNTHRQNFRAGDATGHLIRRRWRVAALAGAALLCVVVGSIASRLRQAREIAPLPDARVIRTAELNGETYKLLDDGRVYRVVRFVDDILLTTRPLRFVQ